MTLLLDGDSSEEFKLYILLAKATDNVLFRSLLRHLGDLRSNVEAVLEEIIRTGTLAKASGAKVAQSANSSFKSEASIRKLSEFMNRTDDIFIQQSVL